MNILELDQYSLDDAIKFHDRLNPGLWGRNEHLLPEVRKQLLAIADDFKEFLGVPDLKLKDITISGSNAAYTYTDHSDIDLHLVVDMPDDAVYQELFNAKKYQYNDEHDIKIRGADVELYVQPADQPHVSQGIYSIVNDQWLQVPKRKRAHVDHSCVQSKTQDLVARIENAIQSQDFSRIDRLWHKIKTMRQNGLQQHGEFGCDNLAFKLLRNLGQLDQLRKAKFQARDQDLSLTERQKKKTVYGFSDYWYPGTAYAGQDHPAGSQGSESREVKESVDPTTVSNFVQEILDFVDLKNPPEIRLHNDPEWSETNKSFGRFTPETHSIDLTICRRHILDILRTLAHELTHAWQYEQEAVPDEAGETGSPWEDHANAMAGRIMRYMADRHPELFAQGDLNEGASGYIPKNKREAAMPQYSMALSVDVKPGETGRQANKLNLQTDAQGRPELLMPGLANALREYKEANRTQYNNRDLNEPRGPETPPKMPDGTIKVDVSDMYDWYKLGQKISDLSSIDKSTLGKGPPSTVFSFGSEDLENMYSHELTRLGLKTHDLDEPGEEDIDESVDDSTGTKKLVSAILKTVPQAQEIWFYGSRARGDHKKTSDWDFLVIVPDDVVGSDFLDMQLALDNLQQHFPNHDIQAAHSWTGLYGSAKQEGQRIWKQGVTEDTLDESLAQPYNLIDWDYLDPDKPVTTWAALPDGTDLVIEFEREYPFHNDWSVGFKRGGSIAKTGQGKAPRIFATVLLAIKQFIKRQQPDELSFSAIKHEDEAGSRRSLYDALAKKYAAGLGYSLNVKDDTYQQHYIFKKIKPEVAESEGFDQEAGIGIDGKSFKFKIRDLVAFAKKYPVTKVDPNQFADQIAGREEDPKQSMARAEKADLQYPIIVVKRKNGQLWIADGTHRAHKAILNKLPSINARIIPVEDMTPFAVKQGVAEGTNRQPLDFDSLYGQAFKITDNNGDPKKPGFSIVTPLNGAAWHWRERPEFKAIVKQKLNDPGFIGDHKYQQIVDAMSGSDFDPYKHSMKGVAESDEDDSKKLKGFHQSLGNAVRGRVSQMQANMAILKAQNPNTWLWEPGDIVYSAKTGRTYEIVGPWLDSRGTAKYLYRGNDEEQGTFVADRAHQTLKKISGKQGVAESQTAKAGIVQTEVYGTRAYHAKCLEPGCDWQSRRYDKIKQAQAAAKKHGEQHFNKKDVAEGVENNDTAISLSSLGKFHKGLDTLAEFVPERATARYALHPEKWESTFFSLTNKDPRKLKYYSPKKIAIPPGTLVGDMAIANRFYRAETAEEKQKYAEEYRQSLKPYPVDVSQYRMPELLIPREGVAENFADGRNPGRKGLAKRVGVDCKQPVSKLRSIAKNSSGERQRMAHWCANMKAGRQKAHESLDEVRIDNKNGIGQMPFNDSIDYHGLRVYTTPKIFLALSLPLSMDEQDRKIIEFLKTQKDTTGFGAPYLEIAIPEQWEAGDFQQPARIVDHDGRHRMMAILETEGNNLVETHLRARYFKNRNLTADIIKHLNQKVVSQNKKILNGPWFKPALPQINEASGTGDYHLWGGRVRVKNADFDNAVDVAVWAKTAFMAQTLLRAQYGKNAVITNVKKVA
jgi:predicted nucleotidyltransferase